MLAELSLDKLRSICDPKMLSCEASDEIEPLETIIGQERAVRALQFGLEIGELGFNIYVAGPPGTGKTTAVRRFLEDLAKDRPVPGDWCYVNNFRDPYRPKALSLPPGRAKGLQADMSELVENARREIRRALESEEYAAKREETVKGFQHQRNELFARISEQAQKEGFLIQATPTGLLTIPIMDGRPLSEEAFLALSPEAREALSQKRQQVEDELKAAIRQARGFEKDANEALEKLDQQVALYALGPLIEDLKEKHQDLPEVVTCLEEVQKDMLANLAQFREEPESQRAAPLPAQAAREALSRKYEVNVLVDHSESRGAAVIMELNPTYHNLFGRIEKEAQFGALLTDFTMIRAGCLHQANGGYVVLPVEELLRNPLAWDGLKRALRNSEITIEEAGERLGFITSKSLQPEPIPLNAKVILIGQSSLYHLLYSMDEDFSELFKVKADFDTRMDRTDENISNFVAFVCTLCCEEGLKHLDRTALARIIDHGSRLAEDQEKVSTRFGEIADVIREASFYAAQDNVPYVSAAHVKRAVDERFYRSSLLQERVREMIDRGTIMIDVAGEEVGQVNGLSVINLGDISFGRPNRITASISLGRAGLIDIEREAKLGGPIHTKGVMILSGYLADRYAQDKPLSLSARLVFEQSYSGVEGDSASSTELYAILSRLSGLPIKQGIAVTGSVNQKGEVQAIGGVNEKIEGFFEVCKAKGLTSEQGALIPESNVQNLMLKEEVVEAVRDGKFHTWPVKTVDEGIEILTGVKAGARREDGTYEEGTVNFLVDERLRELAETMRKFGKEEAEES